MSQKAAILPRSWHAVSLIHHHSSLTLANTPGRYETGHPFVPLRHETIPTYLFMILPSLFLVEHVGLLNPCYNELFPSAEHIIGYLTILYFNSVAHGVDVWHLVDRWDRIDVIEFEVILALADDNRFVELIERAVVVFVAEPDFISGMGYPIHTLPFHSSSAGSRIDTMNSNEKSV